LKWNTSWSWLHRPFYKHRVHNKKIASAVKTKARKVYSSFAAMSNLNGEILQSWEKGFFPGHYGNEAESL
jgi:hypothetical protein